MFPSTISREAQIAACADYLLGMSMADLEFKHKIAFATIRKWIKRTGHFKGRRRG